MGKVNQIVAAVLSCALLLGGCVEHAVLDPAPPNATAQQRLDAYRRLRPRVEETLTVVSTSSNGAVSVSQSSSLILGDGTTVVAAEDLAPVVPATSPTARHGLAAAGSRGRAHKWYAVGMVSLLVGTAVMLSPLVTGPTPGDPDYTPGLPSTFWIGASIALVGTTVGYIGGALNARDALRDTRSAFATYDDSLREGLGLCVDQLKIVDCSAAPAGPPPPGPAVSDDPAPQ